MSEENNALNTIKEWQILATDMKYDGWYQNHHREKLIEIKEYINSLSEEIFKLHGES